MTGRPPRAGLLLLVLAASCASPRPDLSPKRPAADGARQIVQMEVRGELEETEDATPGGSPSLRARLERLRAIEADADVVGIVLTIGDVDAGLAKLEDLAAAFASVRRSGRKVYCALEDAGNRSVFLAARSCDHIAIAPGSGIELTGLAADVVFVKSALASIGVQADVVRAGAYKDAFEPATTDQMSAEMRESLGALVDDLYATLVEGIAAGRSLPPATVQALVDRGLFDAEEARAARLVDSVRHRDSLRWLARKELRGKLVKDDDGRRAAGAGDVGHLLRSLSGEPGPPSPTEAHLTIVHVSGLIASSGDGGGPLSDEVASARAIVKALDQARRDEHTKAVVLRIDSPGGSASASEEIWRAVARLRAAKPIIASMSDTAASGGYYVAAPATKILAQGSTLTGSIGVISAKVVAGALVERLGARVEVIERGAMAGISSPLRPWSPAERAALVRVTRSTYELFLRRVRTGRGRDLRAVAEGRVWSGRRAVTSGLVDQLGGLGDAMTLARRLGKLDAACPVEVLPPARSLLERVLGGAEASALSSASLAELAPAPLRRAAATLLLAGRERTLAALPFSVHFR